MNGPDSFNLNEMVHGAEPRQSLNHRRSRDRTVLPANFVPSRTDIICGRGRESHSHIGNKRFRTTIALNADRYTQANNKVAKSLVVLSIVNEIRKLSPNGGFVKRDDETGRWFEIGDQLAKEKVGHALRDYIAGKSKKRKTYPRGKTDKNATTKKPRTTAESANGLEESFDGEDGLSDDFFTDFVVDTFLGKKSADGTRERARDAAAKGSQDETEVTDSKPSHRRKDPYS